MNQRLKRGLLTTGAIGEGFPIRRGVKTRKQRTAEVKRLREVLAMYADPKNWEKRAARPVGKFVWYGPGDNGFKLAADALEVIR